MTAAVPTRSPFDPTLAPFGKLTLAETVARADLATRMDRKYIVPIAAVHDLIAELVDSHHVLVVGGRLATTYRTTYFDTTEFTACRAHVQRRRRRWKIRSRLYADDQLCRVEVKLKDGRGYTIKSSKPAEVAHYGTLTAEDQAFVSGVLADDHPRLEVPHLVATSELTYVRTCLVDPVGGTRLTLDTDLQCTLDGHRAWLDPSFAVVETKGGHTPSAVDRLLVHNGARAQSFSKYVATTSLLHPAVPDNDVRGLRGTSLHADTVFAVS
ncbi:MAG: hypothetical protein JWP31_1385 [Aeromicrobium sp.]|nr:hypothetical protein [Aeromicrobium sp.]